jgi:hypothetical protein
MLRNMNDTVIARRPSWIGLLYFYVAALIGLVFVLVGTTMALTGAAKGAVPSVHFDGPCEYCDSKDDVRKNGLEDALSGGITDVIGAPVLIWHLR